MQPVSPAVALRVELASSNTDYLACAVGLIFGTPPSKRPEPCRLTRSPQHWIAVRWSTFTCLQGDGRVIKASAACFLRDRDDGPGGFTRPAPGHLGCWGLLSACQPAFPRRIDLPPLPAQYGAPGAGLPPNGLSADRSPLRDRCPR